MILVLVYFAGLKLQQPGLAKINPSSELSGKSLQEQETILALKSKCMKDGAMKHDEWVKNYFRETFLGDPEYAYNSKLNTCLYSQEYIGESALAPLGGLGEIDDYFVLDVYSNQVILEYTENNGKVISNISKVEYDQQKAELFSS